MKKQIIAASAVLLLSATLLLSVDWMSRPVPGMLVGAGRGILFRREKEEKEERKKLPRWKKIQIKKEKTKDWHDSRGKGFYMVRNKGDFPITVKSDIHMRVIINPGKKEKVYRGDRFGLTISGKTTILPHNTMKEPFEIREVTSLKEGEKKNHYIDITTPYGEDEEGRRRSIVVTTRK